MDRRLTGVHAELLLGTDDPLIVDLGYGASPVTTIELFRRVREIRADVRVVGLELDPERVAVAKAAEEPPGLLFRRGGFELAGLRPTVVRAANVLRQYEEAAAADAWRTLRAGLAPDGLLVDGTCDELGRIGGWVALRPEGPRTLTFAVDLATLDHPATLAERLPKALIHHNVPGEPVHTLLAAFGAAWDAAVTVAPFGPRQRWIAAVERLGSEGWPVLGGRRRWRLGELTVNWSALGPA
jgi:hypothetical protein